QVLHRCGAGHGRYELYGQAFRVIEQDVEGVRDLGGAAGELELASCAGPIGRELEIEGFDNPRDTMDEEVGGDTARVVPIPPPGEITVGIPGALRRGTEPRLPVQIIAGTRIPVDRILPKIIFV